MATAGPGRLFPVGSAAVASPTIITPHPYDLPPRPVTVAQDFAGVGSTYPAYQAGIVHNTASMPYARYGMPVAPSYGASDVRPGVQYGMPAGAAEAAAVSGL
ncbi:uncharacterized protein PHACADRAFT_261824 [Phanerochaete carnosa HHB-10118-sp]|uniref:Uncharacterized protein n=1 Tax=Phanerochaete carnosa (strain HHB-10118-sp) TaxID=650164 RepID=K5VXN3_PHACS|nr:uncharacterized protein PHACADRAFT_261824 [Phanerochaete carnosa HHB-10118-sp]EKM51590.1 hypothetical protein PHACADRAFT_261824 [Phanerochaete carnosa HHB-10118-sp]